MQPYTHPIVGAAIGAAFFPHNPWAQVACVIGAGLPDVPIALQAVADIAAKRPLFSNEQEGSPWFLAKEISHSPLLWFVALTAGVLIGGEWGTIVKAFVAGIFSHYAIDALTHCGPSFRATDQSLAWPYYQVGWVPKLGSIFGIWEYRRIPPTLIPKAPEVDVIVVCLALTAWFWL